MHPLPDLDAEIKVTFKINVWYQPQDIVLVNLHQKEGLRVSEKMM